MNIRRCRKGYWLAGLLVAFFLLSVISNERIPSPFSDFSMGRAVTIEDVALPVTNDDSYIKIGNWSDLHGVRNNLTGNYRLMNNLNSTTAGYFDLASPTANSGQGWLPIGDETDKFSGTFDGQGYVISDLFIDRSTGHTGLFGYISGGYIGNLGVQNASVTGSTDTGGLAGYIHYSTVNNSYFIGNVTGLSQRIGGLVGSNYASTVCYSHSAGTVIGSATNTGGLIGYLQSIGNDQAIVTHSYSAGNITGVSNVGGLVGQNNAGVVNYSYSAGNVKGSNQYAGGMVGYTQVSAQFHNCYSTGSVNRTSGSEVSFGGFVGYVWSAEIFNCYSTGSVHYENGVDPTNKGFAGGINSWDGGGNFWDMETSGQDSSPGATPKTTENMINITTFSAAGWNITAVSYGKTNTSGIWNIVNEQTYPFLSWEPPRYTSNHTDLLIIYPLEGATFKSTDIFNLTVEFNETISGLGIENAHIEYSLDGGTRWLYDNVTEIGSGRYNITIDGSHAHFIDYGWNNILVNASKNGYINSTQSINIFMYRQGIPEIITSGPQSREMSPVDSEDFAVEVVFNLFSDTMVIYWSTVSNPTEFALSEGFLFIELLLNETQNLKHLNITIEFLGSGDIENSKAWWFNASLGAWQEISLEIDGNVCFFSVDHASLFAISGNIVDPTDDKEALPPDLFDIGTTLIIIGAIVAFVSGGVLVVRKRKIHKKAEKLKDDGVELKGREVEKTDKPSSIPSDAEKKKSPSSENITGKKALQSKSILPAKSKAFKKAGHKKDKIQSDLNPSHTEIKKEKEELEKTEAEVGVEKQQFICVVHKGIIHGTMYTCPHCQTLYCYKCASALNKKGEKCWSCDEDIVL